ncbi:hypothetical protein Tco_0173838 [Tanacetum coccineum]
MINYTQAEAMGILTNVLCQVGVTTLIVKFLILDIPIDREAPIVVGRGFLYTVGGIVNTPERLFLTFDGICHQTFRAARSDVLRTTESDGGDEEEYEIKRNKFGTPMKWHKTSSISELPLVSLVNYLYRCNALTGNLITKVVILKKRKQQTMGGNDDETGPSRPKRSRQYETVEEVLLPQVHHEFLLWEGCTREAKSRMGYDEEIDEMLRIRLREARTNKEIFTYVAWIRAFNINEPIYSELCHEFYSTYEFDKVCADDELQTKKIIKFRLGGCAHNLTLLEFARRLGLYHVDELDEEGFDVYFQGGLRSDEHFNAQEYWLSISREENLSLTTGYDKIQKNDLWLLIMFDARHQNGYANFAWLIVRWIKRKGAGTHKESQICCGQFITKLARKARMLSDEVIRSLSVLIYYKDLDTTTLRELIDFEGRLILEDPQPGVPRVAIPRPPRASMQDLYDRMGSIEIRQEDLGGAYNPPGYAQPQYDQYYQQYPPQPPQYQQQQQQPDNDE